MYDGNTQAVVTTSPSVHNAGETILFNCVAQDASPAAAIFWRLPSRGATTDLPDTDTPEVAAMQLLDTTSVLDGSLTYAAGDCGLDLTCTTSHPETGNTSPRSDMVTLQVRGEIPVQGEEAPQIWVGDPRTCTIFILAWGSK